MRSGVDVGAVEDFLEGCAKIVHVEGKEVAVLSWRGQWYALRNVCPHRGAPLCAGGGIVRPLLTATDAFDLAVDWARPVLMCPWHRWEFDLSTGLDTKQRDRVKTYEVKLEAGRVLVELQTSRKPTA